MSLENCELIFQGPQGWEVYHCELSQFCVHHPESGYYYCGLFDDCMKRAAEKDKEVFWIDNELWVMVNADGNRRYFNRIGEETEDPTDLLDLSP